jgi:hypothetical protein
MIIFIACSTSKRSTRLRVLQDTPIDIKMWVPGLIVVLLSSRKR